MKHRRQTARGSADALLPLYWWCPGPSRARYSASRPAEYADLVVWGRYYLPEHFRFPPSQMHRWLGLQLDALRTQRGTKLNLIGPRGGAKSTLATFAFVLRCALEGSEPYIWIASDTRHQACAHLENIKLELDHNSRLAHSYSSAAGRGSIWRASKICLRNGVMIEAFGTGQRIRGYRYRAHRPSLIVCDDIQNDRHMESAPQRENSRRWFHGTLLKAGTPQTNIVTLGTALHPDAIGMELARTPGWRSSVFSAIEKWPGHMTLWAEWESLYANASREHTEVDADAFYEPRRDLMNSGAVVLWPEQEDLYTLMKMRVESGQGSFAREKLSRPIAPELREWPDSYFDEHIWFEEWPRNLRLRTMALDPSKGRNDRRADYSAFVLLGIDETGVAYVEADLARRPTTEMIECGVELYQRFRPELFGVESNQFQDLLAADFEQEFLRQEIHTAVCWPIDNRVNKTVRIRRLGPYLSSKRLRFKLRSPSTQLLVDQLKDFPCNDHDDGPDALEMALRLAIELTTPATGYDGLGSQLLTD